MFPVGPDAAEAVSASSRRREGIVAHEWRPARVARGLAHALRPTVVPAPSMSLPVPNVLTTLGLLQERVLALSGGNGAAPSSGASTRGSARAPRDPGCPRTGAILRPERFDMPRARFEEPSTRADTPPMSCAPGHEKENP
jgi:hypothetical protein